MFIMWFVHSKDSAQKKISFVSDFCLINFKEWGSNELGQWDQKWCVCVVVVGGAGIVK